MTGEENEKWTAMKGERGEKSFSPCAVGEYVPCCKGFLAADQVNYWVGNGRCMDSSMLSFRVFSLFYFLLVSEFLRCFNLFDAHR